MSLANINEKVFEIVKQGPTLPGKIAKQLDPDVNTMLVGAVLSTLISTGKVCVSKIKVGGSPLYFIPEHESRLEEFISHLEEKDVKTFNLLKEHKVLRDSIQTPLVRFSLRAIKDFAKPFEIEHANEKVLFWRFYSLSEDEALELANKILATIIVPAIPINNTTLASNNVTITPVSTPDITISPALDVAEYTKPSMIQIETLHMDRPTAMVINSKIAEVESHVAEIIDTKKHHDSHASHESAHEHKRHSSETSSHKSKESVVKTLKSSSKSADFFETIKVYITSKNLDIVSKEKVKKSEYSLILKNHDTNEYIYCKAKDKSTISDADIAPALIFAQNKKMSCLFISTGDLSKKTALIIDKEFSGLKFEKIIV